MSAGDFRSNEKSITLDGATTARIEHVNSGGAVKILKDNLDLIEGEVLDATVMSKNALVKFLAEQFEDARTSGVLLSLHLKGHHDEGL